MRIGSIEDIIGTNEKRSKKSKCHDDHGPGKTMVEQIKIVMTLNTNQLLWSIRISENKQELSEEIRKQEEKKNCKISRVQTLSERNWTK